VKVEIGLRKRQVERGHQIGESEQRRLGL
jgi:hypothetical protein